MQAGTERRAIEGARVPLDLWVRLAHEDFEDPFDADGVDVSSGGLALRSDYLPEIGDRLRCRFECPPSGDDIELDGEVVWAHDAGTRSGEFGLRFDELEGDMRENLQHLVEHLGGQPGLAVARLHLDGIASPIDGEIVERDADWLTVEQELPFLEIGMGVSIENGGGVPRGRLARVDLRLEDGTPRLVLGVELDSVDVAEDLADPEDVVLADAADDAVVADAAFDSSDATLQDVDLPAQLDEEVPAVARQPVQVFRTSVEEEDTSEGEVFVPDAGDSVALEPSAPRDLMALVGVRLSDAQTKLRPHVKKMAESAIAAKTKLRPALVAFWAKTVALFSTLSEKAGPRATALFLKVRERSSVLLRRKGKRRKTTAAPRRVAGAPRRRQQRGEAEAALSPRKKNRRILALSVLAFAGVGAAVYALGGDDAPAEVEAPLPAIAAPAPEAASAPIPAPSLPPPPVESAPAPAPLVTGAEGEPAAAAAPAQAPEPRSGRLDAPSYPTLRDAASSSGPVAEGLSFGSDSVENARSATLRMSQPVTGLRGQRQDGGFVVTIPGALSLDRAAPIAAANPSVERATIFNRADHSVLTVRFVAGRTPDYRVVARGSEIEISIGR